MRVRYVGKDERTNSFGTFKPGKLYDVSEKVGQELLSVPALFIPEGGIQPSKAELRVIEVDETGEAAADATVYDAMSLNELKALCRTRGVMLQRGVRKAEVIKLLVEADGKVADIVSNNVNEQ